MPYSVNNGTVFRTTPEGPNKVVCRVVSNSDGHEITKVMASRTQKHSATANARLKAFKRAKQNLQRRWNAGEFELLFYPVEE